MTDRTALDTWLDESGNLLDRLEAECSHDDCDRTAGWESFQPGDPDSIRPLCQTHAEQVVSYRLSGNTDYPIVQLAGL